VENQSNKNSIAQVLIQLHLPAIAIGLGLGATVPVVPEFAKSFGVGPGEASLVFVSNMLGALFASIPVGYMLDRIGRRRILIIGPALTAVSAFLVALSGSFIELLIFRFIGGWGTQMWTLSRLTMIADTNSNQSRGRMITSLLGVQHVGTLAGPIVGGFLAVNYGLQVAFVFQGIFGIVATIPGFLTKETAPGGRPAHTGSKRNMDSFSWKSLLIKPIPVMFLAQWLGMTARGGIVAGSTVFVYASYAYDATPATLGILSSAMAGIGIPLTFLAGYLMDKFGRKTTIVPGLAVLGSAMAFLGVTSFADLGFNYFVLGFVVLQVTNSLLTGSWQVIGSDLAPEGARGRFFAVGRTVTQAGFATNPAAFAVLTSISGFTLALGVIGSAGMISAGLLGLFVPETHKTRSRV
tara:strand:- start:4011 stop:5234 length:1224 start_codon:yes stop_codon:yes gene_type:complete